MQKCAKDNCDRRFPNGISSMDGVCFPCRWPKQWSEQDEASYKATLEAAKKPAPKKAS